MQAVQVTLDVEQWMSALQDLTARACTHERDRLILLRLDVMKRTLTLFDEAVDSQYKITLPLVATTFNEVLYCRVSAGKMEPMIQIFADQNGELKLTCRSTTLSFKIGKKQLLIPNKFTSAPRSETEDSIAFYKNVLSWDQIVRFTISDLTELLLTVESCSDPMLKLRVGNGTVAVHQNEYTTDSRKAGAYYITRETLCNRLQQLPSGVTLDVAMADNRSLYLTTNNLPVLREITIKPLPATTLFISKREAVQKSSKEPNLWTNSTLEKESRDPKAEKRPPNLRDETFRDDTLRNATTAFEGGFAEHVADDTTITDDIEAPTLHEFPSPLLSEEETPSFQATGNSNKESVLELLEKWPGLSLVKKQLRDIAHFAVFEKERMEILNLPMKCPTLHMAFLGNPGTGKTMVARTIGRIFKEMGLLSKGHVVEVDRQSLVGAYMGHTEANLAKYVKRAIGGVLFVDEAYALYKKDSSKDFGMTAINGLVKVMEDHRQNLIVILAGYKREMNEFFSSNPGLRERIPFHIDFPDYSSEELLQIAEYIAAKDHYVLTDDAKSSLLRRALREKIDETYGNGRTIRNLLEKAIIHHSVRAADEEPSEETYTTLTADDFQMDDLQTTETLEDVLAELDQLVGLEEVKRLVKQMVDVFRLEKKRHQFGLEDKPLALHMAFTGNPGTGKTTVARLMGRILRAMDLLPKGHFVEASRKDLVAGYMGQTALKTAEKIKEATGGVLFIDEAYALGNRGHKDFGAEALATLIKEMEDKKGLLTVVLAGYTKEMEALFKLNPGLKSRVRFNLHFPDYTATDLVEIVKRKARSSQYRLTDAAEEALWGYFIRACFTAGDDFGNGRLAEQVFEKAILRLSTRVGRLECELDKNTLMTITEEDIGVES